MSGGSMRYIKFWNNLAPAPTTFLTGALLWHLAMQHWLGEKCIWAGSSQKGAHDRGRTRDIKMDVDPIAAATFDSHTRDVCDAPW